MPGAVAGTALATALALVLGIAHVNAAHAATSQAADTTRDTLRSEDAGDDARLDQCVAGVALHLGGSHLKAAVIDDLTNKTPAQLDADLSEGFLGGPFGDALGQDKSDVSAYGDAYQAQLTRWEAAQEPYLDSEDEAGLANHAPEFGRDILEFTAEVQEPRYWTIGSAGTPQPGQAARDSAAAIVNAQTSSDPAVWLYGSGIAAGQSYSAGDLAEFLQFGGFPKVAADPGSVEYRTEVEQLKANWGNCDTANPMDPYMVLDPVLADAKQEWQTEFDAVAAQRKTIIAAEATASDKARIAADAMIEGIGQAWIAEQILLWQKYWATQNKDDNIFYPSASLFTKAAADLTSAKNAAAAQVTIAKNASTAATAAAASSTTAQTAAYAVEDAAHTPRGRGLLYAQQSAQVAKASAAAALAAATSTQTAANAAKATVADSKTLLALAQTQSHATEAEFRRAAAQEAADQAKAAADGAAAQAADAAKQAATAVSEQAVAEQARDTAKTAAADAAQKRATAEQERDTAAAAQATASARRADAESAESLAATERDDAAHALSDAQAAGDTAAAKRAAAEQAEQDAATARNRALAAERDRDALTARAEAYEAAADAADGTDAAASARAAADDARSAADDATTAATSARAAADTATTAAVAARAAATQATAAAARSQAAADQAHSDYATAYSAAQTAHAAAADAIAASAQAAQDAENAEAFAATAKEKAATAKNDAVVAADEADQANAASAVATGQAYATSLAATAASDTAQQVIDPANEAISAGEPYQETDTAAAFAVLVGQSSKTLSQQQAAAAAAKAAEAAQAATDAAALAAGASADAKAAAQAASAAASSASQAAQSMTQARASATQAAAAATAAKSADAASATYAEQAGSDWLLAQSAANEAGSDAAAARNDATDAETDATTARQSATDAENDATTARSVADQADTDATAAETAAANAQQSAQDAQDAASHTEEQQAQDTLADGGSTGTAGMFTVQKVTPIGDPVPQNTCELGTGNSGCDVTFLITFTLKLDFYFCDSADAGDDVSLATCPPEAVTYLGSTSDVKTMNVTQHFSTWDIVKGVDEAVIKGVWDGLTGDFEDCANGSAKGCFLSALWFAPPQKLLDAVNLIRAFDAALRTGIGVDDAFNALRALDLDAAVVAQLQAEANFARDVLVACTKNSFPGSTQVLMADGSHRAITALKPGDLVTAADPETGASRTEPVTAAFEHTTDRLVTITFTGGAALTSTAGHRVFVPGYGWDYVSALHRGDRVRGSDGTVRTVQDLTDRSGLAPSAVYDLTVDGLHTFFVTPQRGHGADVLVHNCLNLNDENVFPASGAHTLSKHVNLTPQQAGDLARTSGKPVTIWTDQDIAQQAIDRAVSDYFYGGSAAQNAKAQTAFNRWRAKAKVGDQYPTEIEGQWDAYPSLGKKYTWDGTKVNVTDVGNNVRVVLMKWPHPGSGGFLIKTSYPF